MVQEIEKKQKKRLAKKLDYILLQEKISSRELAKTLGYSDGATVGRWRNEKDLQQNIMLMAQESLEKHFDIPLSIWNHSVEFDEDRIDRIIKEYRDSLTQKKLKNNNYKITTLSKNDKVILNRLQGTWYSYTYPSQPKTVSNGIWIIEITIDEQQIVKDVNGNIGTLHIRREESYIEKITRETGELILIRFSNYQVPYGIFHISIQSNEIGTNGKPILNFGFYSRELYSAEEAKVILGDIKKSQLKLDLDFNDRIVENYKY